MLYKKYEMNSFNLYTIKTDKFKNCHMEVIFRKQVGINNVTRRVFLNDLLAYSSKQYPTKREMNIYLEEIYNAYFSSVTSRSGNVLMSVYSLDFIAPKYTEEDMLRQSLKLPFEFLFNPNIVDGAFDLGSYNVIKNRLYSEFETMRENAAKFAIRNAIKSMDNDSVSSITMPGIKAELDDITREDLVKEYKDMLESDVCDIFIIGDLDMDSVAEIIKEECLLRSLKRDDVDIYVENKSNKKVSVIHEKEAFSQAQLVMIYNLENLTSRERNTVIGVFNSIFGSGSISSKLAQNLREKNSLCYTVSPILQKNDNLLFVYAGIDVKNFEKAVRLVKKSLVEMQQGDFSEEDVEDAKLYLTTVLRLAEDSEYRLVDNYVYNVISDRELIQDEMKNLKTVSKMEVIAVAKKLKLNTVYCLSEDGDVI